MGRPVVYVTLLGLFALVTTLPNKDDWNVYNFHINSTVTGRYATTVIKSRVANRMNESKEIEFHVRIPKNAFITKFRMFIDGQVYDGTVKAKEQAQRQYTEAVSRGESAGLVSSVGRTLEEFKTSVTVAAHKKITFELTYEELMKRTLGKYELQIHARPMQPVQDFKVDVYIHEKAGISFIDVRGGLSTKALANAITKTHVDKQAWVHFYPTEDQQKTCDSCGEQGMNGDLVIVYDVNRDSTLGEIKKSRGYFLHHFAPSELPRVPKNVVFVIDQSGSMHGKKMQQTRLALIQILNDLAEDDHFGLITFDDKIFHWKREMVQATSENIKSAKSFAREIQDRGSTDINKAVLEGTRILNANHKAGSASILILLTDGDPTSGVTNREEILSNVRRAIADKFPLYCLGFGFDVNFEFLEKMSLQNNGVARRIYEDSDADLQLKGFYEEVATPLLVDVAINYSGVTNLTQSNFSIYYNGSEIVVAGQVTDNDIEEFHPQVIAISGNKTVTFSETNTNTEEVSDDQIQRVWAYLTVKQLLQKELVLSGPEKEAVKKEALELSLKYNFVTPLTSMVVTKPPGEDTDVLHKPKEGKPDKRYMQINFGPLGSSPAGLPGMSGFPGRQPGLSVNTKLRLHSSPSLSRRYPQSRPLIPSFHSIRFDEYEDQVFDFDLMLPNPTVFQVPLDVWHTFLIQSENQSLPLCFHLKQDSLLKLFHQPSKELYVNGELDSDVSGGFKKIVIHFNNDHHVEVDPKEIIVRVGQTTTHHTEQDIIPAGSVIVIRREKEIDITAGDMRLVIIVHGQMGKEFLWPVLRQQPSDNNTEGILALKPVIYEVIQQTPTTKLKIKDQEIEVKSDFYTDFSVVRPVLVTCWLLPLGSVLQKPIGDFVVAVL